MGKMGSIDSILMLKAFDPYSYIQDNCFPRQQIRQKVYLFKILSKGMDVTRRKPIIHN